MNWTRFIAVVIGAGIASSFRVANDASDPGAEDYNADRLGLRRWLWVYSQRPEAIDRGPFG